jgi:multisubunit Na+/H+ antiporter MnhG subunit
VSGVIKHFLGAASLGLGLLGVAKPDLFVRLTGAEKNEARGLGFRDLLVGVGIYAAPRVGLAQRALADLGDAIVFARRKPVVVPIALASAALAAYAATRSSLGSLDDVTSNARRGRGAERAGARRHPR